ncbi:hypothetical protein LRS17_15245, partial [Klebsiella pneumoniae]|nr:hypothetical protein [Klebsiella pneumoniae]
KIGPDPRNFNQRVSLGRNDLLIRTFPRQKKVTNNNKYPYLYDSLIKISRKEQKNIPIIYTGKK